MLKSPNGNIRLYTAHLNERHRARPYNYSVVVDGVRTKLPPPHFITIEECGGEIIVWHWDNAGEVQTHSHADSAEDAMERTEIEFGLSKSDWSKG
jgi:hypothetical protein